MYTYNSWVIDVGVSLLVHSGSSFEDFQCETLRRRRLDPGSGKVPGWGREEGRKTMDREVKKMFVGEVLTVYKRTETQRHPNGDTT